MPIKGKQILDDSLQLQKLSSGIKILDSTSKLGVNKTASEFTDPNEYVTKQYVDDLSDDIDNETIVIDGSTLKVNIKTPVDSDEIAIIIDGTNGIHLNNSDITATILTGDGLTSSLNGDNKKTLSVNYGTAGNQVNADVIPTVGYMWNTSAISGASIQDILIAFDSDISTLNATTSGEVYTFQNGITETINIVRLGGDLTQNTTINGDSGSYSLTINEMSAVTLATQSGSSLIVGTSNTTYTQGGSSSAGIQYAGDYSSGYTLRSLVDKAYVDNEITSASTSGYTVWDTLEVTGSGVSGTSGQVSYLGAITFEDAIDEATVYVNGVRVQVPTEAYFDTPGNAIPAPGSTLYFDLDQLGYDIETDDELMITYLLTQQ
jgi:hypothetical protein